MTSISFEDYKDNWLIDIQENNPSTVELGRRFAQKILSQWLDSDDSPGDLIYCDGAGDGGIDVAYLERGNIDDGEGDTWYLVQSKYGAAYQGTTTLLHESIKVLETLSGKRKKLSSLAEGLLERLSNFRAKAGQRDRLIIVFATVNPLNDEEKRTLERIRTLGREEIGSIFDVESISVSTIYQRVIDDVKAIKVPITIETGNKNNDLLVGTITLNNLYNFLRNYRDESGDLDQIYDKNVRRFLGGRRKVNKAIAETLRNEPEQFGLFNNGITIVVSDFQRSASNVLELTEPYIVNGCQTTKTIWEVCAAKFESGGTGKNTETDLWAERAAQGMVVTKIVKIGEHNEQLLKDITQYTNSQNAVTDKDFLALDRDFRDWSMEMAAAYEIFLEIQRGGWESRRAFQKQHPKSRQFTKYANAFDLLKIYGSGWLGECGVAFGRNAAFLPNGKVYKEIISTNDGGEPFGVGDFYAAYLLGESARTYHFGRGADKISRRQTKFLYYFIAVELLKDLVRHQTLQTPTNSQVTQYFLRLFANSEVAQMLTDDAVQIIDEYFTQGSKENVFNEIGFTHYNADLNGFLKSEQLSKPEFSPNLHSLLKTYQHMMGRKIGKHPSSREVIWGVLSS